MKRRILIINAVILIALTVSGCRPKLVAEPLFKDAAIQDSLLSFLERIDSIPNSYMFTLLFLCMIALLGSCGGNDWPPETAGPNLPVRYCDIYKGDKDKTVIGYAFVDTTTQNWLLTLPVEGSSVFTPVLSELRKTERILQKAYPSIVKEKAYDQCYLAQEGGLRNYARQYVFLKGPDGKKYVSVHFVLLKLADMEDKEPYDPDDLSAPPPPPGQHGMSRFLLRVDDGGDAYWRVLLDLDEEKVLKCFVNGHA